MGQWRRRFASEAFRRINQCCDARNHTFPPPAAIGCAAAPILPAFPVMRRVATSANHDLAGQAVAANAAARVFHELRLFAGDKFDAGRSRQIELIDQRAATFDE